MKRTTSARQRNHKRPRPQESSKPPSFPARPLKPRRRLFVGLMIALAVWVVILLGMYFATVYPQRHALPSPPAWPDR